MGHYNRCTLTCLVVATILLSGCAGTIVIPEWKTYDITDYWPIDTGNGWTFRVAGTSDEWSMTVGAREWFGGELCYPVIYENGSAEVNYYRPRYDGLYYFGWYDPGTHTSYVLDPPVFYSNMMMAEETTHINTYLYANGVPVGHLRYTFTVVGEQRITVPLGTFDTLKIEIYISGTGSQYWWFIKDVGPARIREGGTSHGLVDTNML